MKTIRLLAVSPSCIESVNRAVYRCLATHYNIDVHLVVPRRQRVGIGFKECAPITSEPFPSTMLQSVGPHPRLLYFKGLSDVIQKIRPSHILLEADPATLLVRTVIRNARNIHARVWVIALENMQRNYLLEAFQALCRFKPTFAIGGFIIWLLSRLNRPGVSHVFTISSDSTTIMSRMGFAGRITQMPLGFAPHLFYPQSHTQIEATRQRLGLNTMTIAYFGRLIPEKGVHLLLQALANLKDLSWQFLIDKFGDYHSPYVSEIQRQILSLGIGDRVVTFDAKHEDIPDYMNAADIVVLPSISAPKYKEQYGRVIPEAMACRKIVVGSQSGAIPELIADAGFVFPEGDVSKLAGLLRHAMTSSKDLLDEIRSKALKRAHQELSARRQAELLYNKLSEQ